jgi:hypothetical protein
VNPSADHPVAVTLTGELNATVENKMPMQTGKAKNGVFLTVARMKGVRESVAIVRALKGLLLP